MECPQATDRENSHQIWKTTVNILNKQSRTADKGRPLSVVVGWEDHRSSLQKLYMLQNGWQSLSLGQIVWNAGILDLVNTELELWFHKMWEIS